MIGLVVMVLMSLMDLTNNFFTSSLFILFMCILNIILWRLINQARASIRTNNVTSKEVIRENTNGCGSVSAATDEAQIIFK